ncbi:MAG: sodium:proton antiporter [Actinomycetota bacterium]|nr:sodium:proton antiporter [Actinomycetota bacterium]
MSIGIDAALIIVGASLLVLGLMSRLIKRVFLSSVLLALLVGVAVGPEGLSIIDPAGTQEERRAMEELARLTLAIALMGAGLHVTRGDLRDNARRCFSLLTFGMVGMWVATGLGAWLLLDLPFWAGFLLGAILTPTDPVVASTLVTGPLAEQNLPRGLRRTLQIESGANDGLALPFVLLAVFMLIKPQGEAVSEWLLEVVKEVGLAVAIGLLLGYAAAKLAELSLRTSEMEQPNLLGLGLALALLTLGLVHMLGGSGILAVFVAALRFSTLLEEPVRERVEETQETVTKFFILPAFVFFGAILPWSDWVALGIPGLAFVAWVLLLRRPPVVPLALAVTRTDRRSTAFLAWFGPLGVAAIYYATFIERYPIAESETIFAAASLAICGSIVVHSITATPGVRLLAGRSPLATLKDPLDPRSETAP